MLPIVRRPILGMNPPMLTNRPRLVAAIPMLAKVGERMLRLGGRLSAVEVLYS